jgi:hypothetical protein
MLWVNGSNWLGQDMLHKEKELLMFAKIEASGNDVQRQSLRSDDVQRQSLRSDDVQRQSLRSDDVQRQPLRMAKVWKQKQVLFVLAVVVLLLSACTAIAPTAGAGASLALAAAEQGKPPKQVLQFDVAEDMHRFIFDQDVVYDDGMPADGSSFITRGYLYPAGTLDGASGVNPDGSPEFPDQVIGEWICQGYMINDAGHATSGVWVFSTQFFQLSETPGAETIVTQGYELADLDVAISRAITGGSGQYKTARGESSQTLLGFNASEGVNLRVEIALER